MNEKYIQAAILGSLIGGAIVLDDFIKPDCKQTNKKHMIIKSDIVDTEFKSKSLISTVWTVSFDTQADKATKLTKIINTFFMFII